MKEEGTEVLWQERKRKRDSTGDLSFYGTGI
jgi:hypothetical protein